MDHKIGDRVTFQAKPRGQQTTTHSGEVKAVEDGVLTVATDQGATFHVAERDGDLLAVFEEFARRGMAAQSAVDEAVSAASEPVKTFEPGEPGSLSELEKLETRATAAAPAPAIATSPEFKAGRLDALKRRAAAGETITDPADADLLYKDEQYRAGMSPDEREQFRRDDTARPSRGLGYQGKRNGPIPLAIVYHGPHYHQAVELLASIFGEGAKRTGHVSAEPGNPQSDTLYLFQSDKHPNELGKRILDSPHAHLFEPELLIPNAEQIDQAAATAANGELPYIP